MTGAAGKTELSPSSTNRKPRVKVCHLVCSSEGATWMFEQLRELRDVYGYEVVAVVSAGEGKLIDKLRAEKLRYHVTHFATGAASPRAIFRLPFAVLKLAWFFRRERFDIVQSHVFATIITARPAAWLADVPVRLAMIASPFSLQARISRYLERATCWMETMLIPSCRFAFDLCKEIGVAEEKVSEVIYYGPDERKFDPLRVSAAGIRREFGWPDDTPIVCKVAYFYHRLGASGWVPPEVKGLGHKGHEDLVKAAPIILSEFPNAKFLLIGSGWGPAGEEHMQEVKELVQRLGLQSSVIFPGYRADANRILREANVAVQASLNENLGGIIEALLMGCPTVATRVGGMVDAVMDGETGVLVCPGDPDDLARGIKQMLRDPERARAMGRAGRELMLGRFTLQRTASDLAELYNHLISKTSKQGYDPVVSLARLCLAVPLFAYLVFRLIIMNFYLNLELFSSWVQKARSPNCERS